MSSCGYSLRESSGELLQQDLVLISDNSDLNLELISQLKAKGFIESRKVGINKFGLFQVAYNSYDTVEEARLALSKIRNSEAIR